MVSGFRFVICMARCDFTADIVLLAAESHTLRHLRVEKFVDHRYEPARPRRDLRVLGTRQNRELRVWQEAEQFDGTFRSHDIAIAADHQSRRGTRAAVAEAQEVCAIDAEMFERRRRTAQS